MIRVLLDANVYFAGCASPKGASAFILELARKKEIQVVASRLILREAELNLRLKSTSEAVEIFHRLFKQTELQVIPSPDESTCARYEEIIHPKDVPVLAAAVAAKVDYIVTLDRRHFLNPLVLKEAQPIKILVPGDFLNRVIRENEKKANRI